MRSRTVVQKLFDDIAVRYAQRPGGYTRITKIGPRAGDKAPISLIELTERGDRARSEAEKKRERRRRAEAEQDGTAQRPDPGRAAVGWGEGHGGDAWGFWGGRSLRQ